METCPQLKKAYMRIYSEAEISRLSRKELEQAVLELQQGFVRLEEINQESDSKTTGEQAEMYVAQKVNGTLCGRDNRHCDVVSASRHKLEVKFSNLISPNTGGAPLSRVWKWIRLFGEDRGKVYDRLILTGEPTQQAKDEDRRNGREPRRYELFE